MDKSDGAEDASTPVATILLAKADVLTPVAVLVELGRHAPRPPGGGAGKGPALLAWGAGAPSSSFGEAADAPELIVTCQ